MDGMFTKPGQLSDPARNDLSHRVPSSPLPTLLPTRSWERRSRGALARSRLRVSGRAREPLELHQGVLDLHMNVYSFNLPLRHQFHAYNIIAHVPSRRWTEKKEEEFLGLEASSP